MTQLTASQIANLRKRPQSTKLYLSIYQPKTIFQTRVTGTYNVGDAQIRYYSTITGSYQNIYPNLVARIGSSQGGNEYGELRVRNATGTYITFAENEMVWQQGTWLTLIDYIDIAPVYPRIIQDPSNQTNVIFYKDYDIPYSNQNTIYGTFPCAGPHRAGFIVTGAYSSYWSSTGTYNVNGDSLTYSWAFEGGTPTGSTAKDPGFVRYTTPGHYKTRLITTSASGAQDVTYRYISVYQKPNQGTFNPIEAWDISELSGSRGEGGYTARIKIMSILPEIQPKALIVIWAEDTYGGNQLSIGGNSQNNESIVFVGYILNDSIKFNYQQSTMEFDVGSVSELMKDSEGFSVSCESKAAASTWYELTEMTVQKALYHYLRWHSTILNVTDFQFTNEDRLVQYLDTDRESMFDAIDNFLRKGLLGSLVTDRQGKLWAQISHYGLFNPFSTSLTSGIPIGMTLNKQDWMGDPTIHERRGYDTSFIELGGIAYYGVATNTFSALLSNAPGPAPFYRGKTEREEGLILISQAQLNQVAANYLAYHNTQFNEITMPINGNYRNLDIAPQERQYLVITPSDTVRNVDLQDKPFQITSMNWSYNSVNESFYPDIVMEQIATGTMAQTVLIPVTPPYVDSGYDYPNLQLPTYPVFNPPSAVGPSVPTVVLLHDVNAGYVYTTNFDALTPNWLQMNGGLTATQYQNANAAFICPNGSVYVARIKYDDDGFIARAPALGQPFVIIEDSTSIKAKYGAVTTGVWGIAYDPAQAERVAYVIGTNGTGNIYVGASTGFTQGLTINVANNGISDNISQDFVKMSFGNNTWTLTSRKTTPSLHENLWIFSANGSSATEVDLTAYGPDSILHMRAGNTAIAYITNSSPNDKYYRTADNFATLTLIDLVVSSAGGASTGAGIDNVGLQIMNRFDPGDKGKSNDGGYSYTFLSTLPPGNYFFCYAGGAGTTAQWIAAGGSVIRATPNFGNAWLNKEGDITNSIPIPNINMVRTTV